MSKMIEALPYRIYFNDLGVCLYSGNKLVSHNQVKKNETELEVAERMIDKYLHGGAYKEWLKIVKIVYQVSKGITKMMSDELWIEFLKSDDAKALQELKRKVLDTALNDVWVIRNGSN